MRTNGLVPCYQQLNAGNRRADLDFRLRAASGPFYANKWSLCEKNVCLNSRVKFFDSAVTSVLRSGSGQRKLYRFVLRKLNVHCRKKSSKSWGHQEALTGTVEPTCRGTNATKRFRILVKQVHTYIIMQRLLRMSRSWMIAEG